MFKKLRALALNPHRLLVQNAVQMFGDYEAKLKYGAISRANYGYCLLSAARLASSLGYKKMSAIEFGVAGGNGLVAMEEHAEHVSKLVPIEIEIYGFDTGEGLPDPVDHRDLPYHWKGGFYKMDVPALQKRLKRAKLVLGRVEDTLGDFFAQHNPAPIGMISFDLDFYSSTKSAFRTFLANDRHLLPRIFCYFDDVIGDEISLNSDHNGQRLAIHEFNAEQEDLKLGFPYYLLNEHLWDNWWHQLWVCHVFKHRDYNTFVSDERQNLPLKT